jgi:hypothetical protein
MRSIAILAACAAFTVGTLPTIVHAQATGQTSQTDGQDPDPLRHHQGRSRNPGRNLGAEALSRHVIGRFATGDVGS